MEITKTDSYSNAIVYALAKWAVPMFTTVYNLSYP